MFTPSLKRSKQTPLGFTASKTTTVTPPLASAIPAPTPLQLLDSQRKQLIPTSFFASQSQNEQPNDKYLFAPLNFEWRPYHRTIQRMVDSRLDTAESSRGIGSRGELMWYFQDNSICLWARGSNKQVSYSLPQGTECVAVGELESSSLHFKSAQLYVLAVAVYNNIVLYGIEKQTLRKNDLKFCRSIAHSRYIQALKFVNGNQIVAVSDTGRYLHIDFTAEVIVSQQRQTLLERSMPFLPLLYPTVNSYVENVLVSGDLIFTLIREERKANWFSVKARQLAARFVSTRGQHQMIIETRKIVVMRLDRRIRNITYVDTLKQEQILSQIHSRMPEMDLESRPEEYKIVSIYLERKDQEDRLGLVTKNGCFVSVKKEYLHGLSRQPINAVRQCNVGPVGFFLDKKIESTSESRRSLLVTKSLGLDNLTATQDALWFLSEGTTEVVKCEGGIGQFCECKLNSSTETGWIAFGREGYYIISRLTPKRAFLGYLVCSSEMAVDEPDKSWRDETNFSMFMDTFSKTIGSERVCELLIECLQSSKLTLRLNSTLRAMIREELKGSPNQDYRDWGYDINARGQNWQVEISGDHIKEVRMLLLEYQNKLPKFPTKKLSSKGIHCSAYWYALKRLFVKAAMPILALRPNNIKPNLQQVEAALRRMENLAHFIADKRSREAGQVKDCLLHRYNRQKAGKIGQWRARTEYGDAKKEQNDTTFDSISSIPQAHLTESSTRLEETILVTILKVKHYVTAFMYLAELSSICEVPTILQVMKSKRNQLMIKQYLLGRVQDRERLVELEEYLPELELGKEIQFERWKQYQQKYNIADHTNLAEVASFFSSTNYSSIERIFTGRLDLQVDLLLYYNAHLEHRLVAMTNNHSLWNQSMKIEQQRLFQQEQEGLLSQSKDMIAEEMGFARQKVEQCVVEMIKQYLNSDEASYPAAEQQMNSIISIVARHDEHSVLRMLQMELGSHGLSQKVIMLRSRRKNIVPIVPVEYVLSQRVLKQVRTPQRRQYLSTYEAMLQNE